VRLRAMLVRSRRNVAQDRIIVSRFGRKSVSVSRASAEVAEEFLDAKGTAT
jgi:hypothetical protein